MMRWFGTARRTKPVMPDTVVVSVADGMEDARAVYEAGVAHYSKGEYDAAAAAFQRAIACKHDFAEAHFYLGLTCRKRSAADDAADCLLLATTFREDFADAWYFLGLVDLERHRYADARRSFDTALRLNAGHIDAHAAYARLCEEQKQFVAALEHWEVVVSAKPDHALAYCNLGRLTLREFLDAGAATAYVRRALALQPQLAEAHSCLAQILQFEGRCEEAIAACDTALRLDPAAAHTRMIRALSRLMAGEFAAGWRDYEERKRIYPLFKVRKLPYPDWDGSPLEGKRLLIYHEQGLGDEIMFASCLPDVLRLGGACVVECSARLESIFRRSFPSAEVIVADQTSPDMSYLNAVPACDFQVAAGSLPQFFRRRAQDFLGGGYLCADSAAVAKWRMRLQTPGAPLNIGVSWRGGVAQTNRVNRSIEPATLLPLLTTPGINFVSLQYGNQSEELALLCAEHGVQLHNFPEALASYDDTAALASALDLVVSVDTSVAHLAAALGKPVWVMVPANAEWRYMAAGHSMPWYSSMRIFRRRHGAGWESAVQEVVAALVDWRHRRSAEAQ